MIFISIAFRGVRVAELPPDVFTKPFRQPRGYGFGGRAACSENTDGTLLLKARTSQGASRSKGGIGVLSE